MTTLGRGDADLHHDDGTHRVTSKSTSGRAIALHEARAREHAHNHARATFFGDHIKVIHVKI